MEATQNLPQKRARQSGLGIESDPSAALLCVPVDYIDARARRSRLEGARTAHYYLWRARLVERRGYTALGQRTASHSPARLALTFRLCDGDLHASVFGNTLEWSEVPDGSCIDFTARLTEKANFEGLPIIDRLQFVLPEAWLGRVVPVYRGVQGNVAASEVTRIVQCAASNSDNFAASAVRLRASGALIEALAAHGYPDPVAFLMAMHSPGDVVAGHRAVRAARAATILEVRAIGRQKSGYAMGGEMAIRSHVNIDGDLIRLVHAQPEILSHGQRVALNRIRQAVNIGPGSRVLLNGEVGSGKTLVFLLALASVAQASGGRTAVLAPSDLVAAQIHRAAMARFPHLCPSLVTGGTDTFQEGTQMVVGTQALLNRVATIAPTPLAMLVVDEQHKFSIDQRNGLVRPGTHVIEASATPIPRSLALALFDGWVEARIPDCPVAKTIHSHLCTDAEKKRVELLIKSHVQAGRKAILLYSTISGTAKSLDQAYERLSEKFPGKVAQVHGSLKSDAKASALATFASGQCPIMVATTAIEVGVDVPGIGCMVVVGADRFGVAQLHQLRGRLVRDGGVGDFVMMTDKPPKGATLQRLSAVRDVANGFELAERDLELRGFGELLGEAQAGGVATTLKQLDLQAIDFLTPDAG